MRIAKRAICFLSLVSTLGFTFVHAETNSTFVHLDGKSSTFATQQFSVYFDKGSVEIPIIFDPIIETVLVRLIEFSNSRALIEGYADSSGERQANKLLSYHRAQAIGKRLVQQYAISRQKIDMIAFGEDRPIDSTREISPNDRRALIILEPR